MWLGSLMGGLVFAAKTLHVWKPDIFGWVPAFLHETPFMMMAFYMCVVCIAMQILFTVLMPKVAGEDAQNLYWATPLDALRAPGWPILNYKVLAVIVLFSMTALYAVFH